MRSCRFRRWCLVELSGGWLGGLYRCIFQVDRKVMDCIGGFRLGPVLGVFEQVTFAGGDK